mmetsp:Transcript_89286/g.195757  ORF Transcript_89286/g.195757 Transcript_89286/m.195757 type:complete len:112 (+) Transcript_89286:1900-2235(+)
MTMTILEILVWLLGAKEQTMQQALVLVLIASTKPGRWRETQGRNQLIIGALLGAPPRKLLSNRPLAHTIYDVSRHHELDFQPLVPRRHRSDDLMGPRNAPASKLRRRMLTR